MQPPKSNRREGNQPPPQRPDGDPATLAPGWAGRWARFQARLATPVNGASLAVLRMAIGLVMALEAYSLVRPSGVISGHIPLETYYASPDLRFHFPYAGFDWLPWLPGPWMYALAGVLALAGITLAVGLWYRASATTVFLAWGYFFAVESTRTYYQSYYYVELLFAFLMIWMPAARRYSVDACRPCSVSTLQGVRDARTYSVDAWRARGAESPLTVPFWTLFVLRAQLLVMYFYGGVAKLNRDWLLDAVPLRWHLAEPHVTARYAPLLSAAQFKGFEAFIHSPRLAYFLSYTGVVFDLSIGFLLLIRKTRIFGLILMILFHATNHFLIYDNIDWFPVVGVTTALIFLEPDWPERFWNWLRRSPADQKASARPPAAAISEHPALGRWVVPCVGLWLTWQVLMPLRHCLIPADTRLTYEGQSFSWRLKAEDHRALGAQMLVTDPKFLARDPSGRTRLNWNEWHGDPVIYRRVITGQPGRPALPVLPEIVVVLESFGERILYNPVPSRTGTEADSVERVKRIWRETYGREPQSIRRTAPLGQVLEDTATALRAAGHVQEAAKLVQLVPSAAAGVLGNVRTLLNELQSRAEIATLMDPFLRTLDPFTLNGDPRLPVPVLVIEDAPLFETGIGPISRINRKAWKNSPSTRESGPSAEIQSGADPLVIYLPDLGPEAKDLLPQACVFDTQDHPEQLPYVWWNSTKDLPFSKYLHVSGQPFYLRKYARRIADQWEKESGHRPVVTASTWVSLNGRPYQRLVDPNADLASVATVWFGHNPWIKDVELPRIPRTPDGSGPIYAEFR